MGSECNSYTTALRVVSLPCTCDVAEGLRGSNIVMDAVGLLVGAELEKRELDDAIHRKGCGRWGQEYTKGEDPMPASQQVMRHMPSRVT